MRKRERHQPWWPRQVRGWKPGEHRKDFSVSSSWEIRPETFLKIDSYFQKRTFPGKYVYFLPHRLNHFFGSWSLLHSVAWLGEVLLAERN